MIPFCRNCWLIFRLSQRTMAVSYLTNSTVDWTETAVTHDHPVTDERTVTPERGFFVFPNWIPDNLLAERFWHCHRIYSSSFFCGRILVALFASVFQSMKMNCQRVFFPAKRWCSVRFQDRNRARFIISVNDLALCIRGDLSECVMKCRVPRTLVLGQNGSLRFYWWKQLECLLLSSIPYSTDRWEFRTSQAAVSLRQEMERSPKNWLRTRRLLLFVDTENSKH